jgi:hemerythrin-like domain-containing protein
MANPGFFSGDRTGRRRFLQALASTTPLVLAGGFPRLMEAQDKTSRGPAGPGEDVSPAEDLMREHGVLRRILLIYTDSARRLEAGQDVTAEVFTSSAGIVRSFIEDYHEKLEEDFLFPRFRRAKRLVDLVDVLQEQHRAGRRLTEGTIRLAASLAQGRPEGRRSLAETLRQFIRMYEPHAAREDTVLFPALHEILTAAEYDRLGDDFEAKEHELFGAEGFEKMVDRVAAVEKSLGLYDLGQFTPIFKA